jgi:ABC-type transporter Mla MlaB component
VVGTFSREEAIDKIIYTYYLHEKMYVDEIGIIYLDEKKFFATDWEYEELVERIEEFELDELRDIVWHIEGSISDPNFNRDQISLEDITFQDVIDYLKRDISHYLHDHSPTLEDEWHYNLEKRIKELDTQRKKDYLEFIKLEEEYDNEFKVDEFITIKLNSITIKLGAISIEKDLSEDFSSVSLKENLLDPVLKRIESGDESMFRFINLFRLMESFQNERWKQAFLSLNKDTDGPVEVYAFVFKPEGRGYFEGRETHLGPTFHNAMLRAYVEKRDESLEREFLKNLHGYPMAFEYWIGRLVIQQLEESEVEFIFCENNKSVEHAIKRFLNSSSILNIVSSMFLRYLINKGDKIAKKLYIDEILNRYLLNENEADFIEATRNISEYVNDQEITLKIIEIIKTKNEHVLRKLFRFYDLTRYLNKQAIESLNDKEIIDILFQTFTRGEISHNNMLLLIEKIPKIKDFIKDMSEEKKKQIFAIVINLIRKTDSSGIVLLEMIIKALSEQEKSIMFDEISKQNKLVKYLLYYEFDKPFFNNIRVFLLLNMLRRNNFNYFENRYSYSNRVLQHPSQFLIDLLEEIARNITEENKKEIEEIRGIILERIKNAKYLQTIQNLITFRHLFKFLTIDDIRRTLNLLEGSHENECLELMKNDPKFQYAIVQFYAISKNSYFLEIINYFLTILIQDQESEINKGFLNEPLIENIKNLIMTEMQVIVELNEQPNKMLNAILESLRTRLMNEDRDLGYYILEITFFILAPKGIKELLLALDNRISDKFWTTCPNFYYEEFIDRILTVIKDYYPKDFFENLLWFLRTCGYEEKKFGFFIGYYINEMNREDFWSIIKSGKETLMEIENQIGEKLSVINDIEEPEGSGFIVNNGQVERLYIWGYEEILNLHQLPETLGELTHLKKMYIHETKLSTLPKSITKLTSLEELSLQYNKFTTLPEFIGELKSLKKLDLSGNPIKKFPESIGDLKKSGRSTTYTRSEL